MQIELIQYKKHLVEMVFNFLTLQTGIFLETAFGCQTIMFETETTLILLLNGFPTKESLLFTYQ